jgi:hypothetical protein
MKKTRKNVSGVEVRKSQLLHASREKKFFYIFYLVIIQNCNKNLKNKSKINS